MSEFTQTVFEKAWRKDDSGLYLFRSEKHEVMALADPFPKLSLQTVIAPSEGLKGENVHFNTLPRSARRKLHEVSDAIGEKMATHLGPNERVVTHIEGFGVPDHAHIVMFAAERKEGEALYNGALLGEDVVRRTVELLRFNEEETAQLNQRLSHIPTW